MYVYVWQVCSRSLSNIIKQASMDVKLVSLSCKQSVFWLECMSLAVNEQVSFYYSNNAGIIIGRISLRTILALLFRIDHN